MRWKPESYFLLFFLPFLTGFFATFFAFFAGIFVPSSERPFDVYGHA